MAESLFLNKKQIDIFEKPVTRKIQIGDVGDIGTRKSSFSYSITIPMTSRNKQVLELLGVIGNTSRKPFEQIVCDYVVDGVYVVLNGVAIIQSTSGGYKLNIIDGVKGLSDLLSGKKIADLPLSDLDHNLTTQVYTDSYENTEGFIYGMADYGLGTPSVVKVENQAPSIFVHTLFRRIFEAAGLNLTGEFFTTNEKYLTEVLTPSKGYLVEDIPLSTEAKGGADSNLLTQYEFSNEFIEFDRKFTLSDNGLIGASIVNGDIVFGVGGTYLIELTIPYSSYQTYMSAVFKINGVAKSYINLPEGNSQTKTKSITFAVESGDVVSLHLQGSSELEFEGEFFEYSVNYSASISSLLYLETGGQLVTAADYIGDLNQIDFIKDVINRYALVLQPVRATGNYNFKRLEVLLNDRTTAEDWTSKISEIVSETYSSNYAKKNKAVFQYPEATAIPSNDGEMLIDNENAAEEAVMFSSPFEIPVQKGSLAGQQTYLIPIRQTGEEGVEQLETPLKIMHVNRVDTPLTAKLFDEVTGITKNTNIPFLNLEFIDMQYFLGNFYKAFQSMINNYKAVEFIMNLSVIDIVNIDFFRLKFLKQTGRFYYLNSVQNTPRKLSKVNMIEITEFPENLPPSQVGDFSFSMNRLQTRTITFNNLTAGYEDPEVDPPLKFKIISGFNSDILLKQNGVTITAETEILADELNLVAEEVLGGVEAYSKEWVFAIADAGSGSFGNVTGKITANVGEFVNTPPVANAGQDSTLDIQETYAPDGSYEIYLHQLNGSASYDNTGEIVDYYWTIVSKPINSEASIDFQNRSTPIAGVGIPAIITSKGTYTFKLVVTDEFGATDEDTVELIVDVVPGDLN